MGLKRKPACTCSICPTCIATTYARQAKPYTDPAWTGRHPLNTATTAQTRKAA